ncbi:hypothetical protein SAMN05216266_11012 [Amycolatopsis marina]|uniref:Uncharacterized protein n=1 Tax=Amycolatopsis marina TaxID=490629 RepID=A0A1I1ANS9_9PSEU|nr:hypothetical protein [Amycolatopsis marina]SFB39715.1 hypothetical protein SAMN05216266_11012 [Amycolatopsis marina]
MAAQDLVFTILGIDKASDKFDRVGDAIDRMTSRGVKALGGFTVASAASAAAVGAAVGALPLAFVGLGAVALKENTKIKQSFEDLSGAVKTGIAQDAAPLADEFVGAAQDIGAAYQRLRPELSRAFAASAPHVETLTAGVIGFAENAMPGMVRSVERAGPVMDGFESLLKDAGTGLGEFFDIVSQRSDEAGQGIEHFGDLVRGVLPEVGGILGDLTGLWAEHGDEVADVVTRLIGVIGDLSGNALPLVSSSLGHALGMLDAVLSIIEPMTGILGPAIGAWVSLAVAMKGLAAVQSVIGGVTSSVVAFGSATRDAEKRGRALKLAGVGIALGMGMALSKVSALNPEVEALDEGLKDWVKTGKASGEAARVLGADMEHLGLGIDQVNAGGIEKFIGNLVEGIPVLGNFLQGLDSSFARGTERIDALDQSLANMAASGNLEGAAEIVNRIAKETGKSLDEVMASLPGYRAELEQAAAATAKLGTASFQSKPGVDALEESLGVLADQTADTSDKADALNDAWRRLFGVALTMEEAQAAFEGGLDEIGESIKGVKEESENWRGELLNAAGHANITTEAGRALSEQLIQQGEDYKTLAQTAFDTARSQGKSQEEATAAAVAATTERRDQFIREMRQMGFNADQARTLANRYLGIPNDVTTAITNPGMLTAIAAARDLINAYDRIPRHIRTVVETVMPGPFGLAMFGQRALAGGFATGGEIRGPGSGTSDSVLARVSNGEHVLTAREVQAAGGHGAVERWRNSLTSGRQAAVGDALGGVIGGDGEAANWWPSRLHHRPTASASARAAAVAFQRSNIRFPQPASKVEVTINTTGADEEFARALRKMIRVRGGNVQTVLGRRP